MIDDDDEIVTFPPSDDWAGRALIDAAGFEAATARAKADPDAYWRGVGERLTWSKPFTTVKDVSFDAADFRIRWFADGELNVSVNCLDRHLPARANETAIIWESDDPGMFATFTYGELHAEVCRMANVLKGMGVAKGDRVTIYLPMIPQAAIAMLACARIGAVHSVIFGGFSSEAIADRNNDAKATLVITADGGWRRGTALPLKTNVDTALAKSPTVKNCIVVKRLGIETHMKDGRDHWYHDLMSDVTADCPATPLDSEAPLFILYTSGSTGKPKGIKHTTAGYSIWTKKTFEWVFDIRDEDVYWCTADCGWITGHSYISYGPLTAGATMLLYEGAPNCPNEGRFWELIEKYRVSIFYTAPTAIRSFIKWGDQWVDGHDLSSLRLLGSVGEGINPEAWMWYYNKIGGGRCPIVDTWWQTETGGVMMSPLPGVVATKPGSCTKPLPGVVPEIVDDHGKPVERGRGGWLVLTQPWPGMLRGIWGDDERYKEAYWSKVPHKYLAGDNSRCDSDGYYWIMGRIDDVLNVSGHRLSTIEVESALVSHPAVAEAAAVGRPDPIKGEAIAVFVVIRQGEPNDALKAELRKHVRKEIGALAQPDDVRFTASLPKTRSGKIMRRLLRDIAAGKESTGDTSTLEDFTVLAKLRTDED